MLLRFVCLLLLALPALSEPVAWDGPGRNGWLTLTSDHFQAHYPVGDVYESHARRALAVAEQAHRDLVPFFGQAPTHRTQLVLSDDQDDANGWATFFPFPQIRLYLTPPHELSGLEDNQDWLNILVRHEYVHVLHMEMAGPVPALGRDLFGRMPLFFPHSLTTPMLIEGLAVYLETDYEQGTGRLASSWYLMQMQEEVRAGRFASLGNAAVAAKDWPYGQYYLYGAFFIEYLAKTYGEDALKRWLQLYSNEIIPWVSMNDSAYRAFGRSFGQLWSEFYFAMVKRFGTEEAVAWSGPQDTYREQVSTASSHFLYLIERNDEDRPALLKCHQFPDCRKLGDADDIVALAASTDDELVGIRRNMYASGRNTGDLAYFSEGRWRWVTENERLADVRWLPDASGWVATSFDQGLSRLLLISRAGEVSLLWQGEYGELVGDFDVSPDGQTIVAAYKEAGLSWDIASFTMKGRQWERLTDSAASEMSPRFTSEGAVIFVSDIDGRFQIRALDGKLVAASDSAAVAPEPLQGGVWYQEYTAGGFRFRNVSLEAAPDTEPSLATAYLTGREEETHGPVQLKAAETTSPVPYSPWRTLRPYFWLPYLAASSGRTEAGLVTGGTDALGRHLYQLQLTYGSEEAAPNWNLQYQFERWELRYERTHSFYELLESVEGRTILEEDQATLARLWLLRGWRDRVGVHAGLVHQRSEVVDVEPGVTLLGERAFQSTSLGLAGVVNLQKTALNSPLPWGSYSQLVIEDFGLSGDYYAGLHAQLGWNYGFDLAGRQSLVVDIKGGYAGEDAPEWQVGGLPPQEDEALFGRDQLSLRGYDDAAFRGRYYERQRLTYRTQVKAFNSNWSYWPVGADDLQVSLYLERGRAWDSDYDQAEQGAVAGMGFDLRLTLLAGYRIPVPLVLGVAYGFDENLGDVQVYSGLTATF